MNVMTTSLHMKLPAKKSLVIHAIILISAIRACRSSLPRRISQLKAPLTFTTSRLEKEEQENRGIWVDMKEEGSYSILGGKDFDLEGSKSDYDEDSDEIYKNGRASERVRSRIKIFRNLRRQKQHERLQDTVSENEEEHPMRTDEWLVRIKLSPLLLPGNKEMRLFPGSTQTFEGRSSKKKEQLMKFARNGYVVLIEGVENNGDNTEISRVRTTKIGKWKVDTAGVSWSIPARFASSPNICSSESISTEFKRTMLHYHADLVLTKFKEKPRMFRGIVCRDHYDDIKLLKLPFTIPKHTFRPVIATFTAEGIGVDTADISYKSRGFGINSGNKQ